MTGESGTETELKHGTYVHSNVEFQPHEQSDPVTITLPQMPLLYVSVMVFHCL